MTRQNNSNQSIQIEEKWPIARVTAVIPVRDRFNNGYVLKVGRCPLCGKSHRHGGGEIGSSLRLGHRVAHCIRDIEPGGYVLREPDITVVAV